MEFLVLVTFMILISLYMNFTEVEMDEKPYLLFHFSDLQVSTKQFYESIEWSIIEKQIPGIRISQVTRPEGGVFSAHRLYLRIRRKNVVIDVCAFPLGTGECISCRLGKSKEIRKSLFGEKSIVNKLLEFLIYERTFYLEDQQVMFKRIVDQTIEETIGTIRSSQTYYSNFHKKEFDNT